MEDRVAKLSKVDRQVVNNILDSIEKKKHKSIKRQFSYNEDSFSSDRNTENKRSVRSSRSPRRQRESSGRQRDDPPRLHRRSSPAVKDRQPPKKVNCSTQTPETPPVPSIFTPPHEVHRQLINTALTNMAEAMFVVYSSVTTLQTVFQGPNAPVPSISPLHSAESGSNVTQGIHVPDNTNIGDTIYSNINEADEITCLDNFNTRYQQDQDGRVMIDSVNNMTTPQSAGAGAGGDSD